MLHYYILRETARLIGKNVRRRKLIAKPNATVSVDSQGVGSGDSLCALRVGAAFDRSRYNKIQKTESFLLLILQKTQPHQKFLQQNLLNQKFSLPQRRSLLQALSP